MSHISPQIHQEDKLFFDGYREEAPTLRTGNVYTKVAEENLDLIQDYI
jgi:hypothetical protein